LDKLIGNPRTFLASTSDESSHRRGETCWPGGR